MRKTLIWIVCLLVLSYFVYTLFMSFKNEKIFKHNQEFYKLQIQTLQNKRDSLNKVVEKQEKEKDSLKELRNQIIIEKQTAVKEVWNIPNSEMQRRFDERIKKHLQQ